MSNEKLALPSVLRSPCTAMLVVANLVPVVGVLAWGWSVFPVLVNAWAEAVVIGVITVLRLAFAFPTQLLAWILKPLLLPFAFLVVIPYAIVLVALTFFVFVLFAPEAVGHAAVSILLQSGGPAANLLPPEEAVRVIRSHLDPSLAYSVGALAAAHLVSFVWFYLIQGDCNRASLQLLAIEPIRRTWLMMTVVILGGFGIQQLNAPLYLLVPLILAKTALAAFSTPEGTAPAAKV